MNYDDILAIPLFGLSSIYFYNIENKTVIEYILLLFSVAGFILDIFFTYLFLTTKNKIKL
jgi:hypothetical protein